MMIHETFDAALAEWREVGGALNYIQSTPTESCCWQVWLSLSDLAEAINTSPRLATIYALSAGGMSAAEISRELRDWHDDNPAPVSLTVAEALGT